MTPHTLQYLAISPAMRLIPAKMDSPEARVMLTAIALQESSLRHRRQMPVPHARGWWQFEQGGGVRGVLKHHATREVARVACIKLGYDPQEEQRVYEGIEHNDLLACVFARLNLWWLPQPLPRNHEEGWSQYIEAWRPGKPHPNRWVGNWIQSQEAVG